MPPDMHACVAIIITIVIVHIASGKWSPRSTEQHMNTLSRLVCVRVYVHMYTNLERIFQCSTEILKEFQTITEHMHLLNVQMTIMIYCLATITARRCIKHKQLLDTQNKLLL